MRGSAEVTKERFRDFATHAADGHRAFMAFRDQESLRTILFCSTCRQEWSFTDAALRGTPHILDYLTRSGLWHLSEAVTSFKPARGAWAKILLGFLDELEE